MGIALNEEILRNLNVNIVTHGKDTRGSEWKTYQAVELVSKLYFVINGRMELTIDDNHYILERGNLALLPSGHTIRFSVKTGETRTLQWCHFRATLDNKSIFDFIRGDWVIKVEDTERVNRLFERFHQSSDKNMFVDCVEKKCALLTILAEFLGNCGLTLRGDVEKSKLNISEILYYIDRHAVEGNLTLDVLSKKAHVHPNHFIREFKKQLGMSPMKYVKNVQTNIAKEYLSDRSVSIKEIAESMGFETPNYFCSFFKRQMGVTPTEYRRNLYKK